MPQRWSFIFVKRLNFEVEKHITQVPVTEKFYWTSELNG